jgi:SAM-dependent MidA family methyltransferase
VNLRQKIAEEIAARGPIPFSRYMELCLYDPELGYYARHTGQFGKAGDFYTSSDVHAVFGRLLARQFEEMGRALGSPQQIEILELGPGRGLFAQDVLDWSARKFPEFFAALHYSLVERSPALREKLKETLGQRIAAGKASLLPQASEIVSRAAAPITHRHHAPDVPLMIFANEFFDALPVEIVSSQGELRVDARDGRLVETWVPSAAETLEFLDRHSIHPEAGERVEVALLAQHYMSQAAKLIERGFFIVIDYGYTRDEQLAGRHRGTLMTYRQHSAGTNPYEAPGEQDITVHVNFTALAAAAEQVGMNVQRLLTQSQFLMGIGENNQLADAFEGCRLPQEGAKIALQLKHLVTPAGVGETFHVLIVSKGIDAASLIKLSGLSFGRR